MPTPKATVKSYKKDLKTGRVISEGEERPLELQSISKEEFFGGSKPQMRLEKTVTTNVRRNDGTTVHATTKPWGDGREELKEVGVDAPRMRMMKTMTTHKIKKRPEEEDTEGQESNTAEQERALKRNNMFGL